MAAGSAASNNPLAPEDLPCADFGLLGPLKRSPEYNSIRARVTDPKPVDAWRQNMSHYFVFELAGTQRPYALFTMNWEHDGPVSALAITPDEAGTHAEVVNLSQPEIVQTIALDPPNKSE